MNWKTDLKKLPQMQCSTDDKDKKIWQGGFFGRVTQTPEELGREISIENFLELMQDKSHFQNQEVQLTPNQ